MRRAALILSAVIMVAAGAAGCRVGPGATAPGGGPPVRATRTLTVLAAASLTDAFGDVGRRFETTHPGVRVSFGFGASSTLVHQLRAGAPADVVATADERSMDEAAAAGLVEAARVFAANRLAIVVRRGNPKAIASLTDLARPGLAVVLCAREVPCGSLAGAALDRAGARVRPRSLEANVRAVVSKVALGEADAGVVYATDVAAAGVPIEGVAIPPEHNVVTRYPIAVVRGAPDRRLADAFVAFVLSEEGRRLLARSGFEP